jgi:hypothetical protein
VDEELREGPTDLITVLVLSPVGLSDLSSKPPS